jgi:hypothetical protein
VSRLAVVGFLFHVPGLKLFAHATLTPRVLQLNAVALLATFALMAAAWQWGFSVLAAFALGHFAWSFTLVALVRAGQVR